MRGKHASLVGPRLIPPLDLLLRLERRGSIKRNTARIYEDRIEHARRVLDADDDPDTVGVFRAVVIEADHHAVGVGHYGGGGEEAGGGDVDGLADVALGPFAVGGDGNAVGGNIAGPVKGVDGLPFDVDVGGEGFGAPNRVEDDWRGRYETFAVT